MTDMTLQTLFVDELRDIYHAERQLVRALPKLAKAASSPELREALESHLTETEGHVTRLEQAFDMLDETAKTKTCAGMLGIVEEGSDLIKEKTKGSALDAGIIAGAQRAEHYEIAAYGSVMAWARALGHGNVVELLSSTLEEEKAADAKLSELAEAGINEAAASEPNGRSREGRTESGSKVRMSVGGNGRVRATAKGRPVAARK